MFYFKRKDQKKKCVVKLMDTKIYIPGLRQIITKSIFVVTLILYVFLKKANFSNI